MLSEKVGSFVAFIGNNVDIETFLGIKLLSNFFGGENFFFDSLSEIGGLRTSTVFDFSFTYLFNTSLLNLTKLPSFCLLIATNVRFEVPLLNFRLTSLVSAYDISVYKIGGSVLYAAHKTINLSNRLLSFYEMCEFKHSFCKNFYLTRFSYRPFLLSGLLPVGAAGAVNFTQAIVDFVRRVLRIKVFNFYSALHLNEFNFFGFVFQYSSQIHALDVGLHLSISKLNATSGVWGVFSNFQKTVLLYSIGFTGAALFKNHFNPFLVFQGSHGDGLLSKANLIFPALTYIEKVGNYRNLCGIVQKSNLVVDYVFDAKSDILIFQNLVSVVGKHRVFDFFTFTFRAGLLFNRALNLPNEFFFNRSLEKLMNVIRVKGFSDILVSYFSLPLVSKFFYFSTIYSDNLLILKLQESSTMLVRRIFTNLLGSSTINYYGDDSTLFLRTSKTMVLCSNLFLKKNLSFSSTYF